MNTRIMILGCALLLAAPLLAGEKTDILVMKNGDHMTCEVKALDGGVLHVSFDYIDGTTSVDWSKVARLESKRLFHITTEDGSVYTGRLNTAEYEAGRPVKIQVVEAPDQEVVINRSQIVQMAATSEKFWQRFSGDISFGVIFSKANQQTQYSLGTQAAYLRERWRVQASYDSNLSSNSNTDVATRNSFNASIHHLMRWNNWYYSGLGGLLQSTEQGIRLQSTLGGGVGRYFKNSNRARVAVLAGAAWQNTNYEQTVVTGRQNLAAALIYAEARMFRFSKTNLDMTAALLPAVSDLGRVRFSTNADYYIKIFGDLKWTISFYGNWDNRPPPGFSKSDYGTSSGLTWTFGLK